LDVPIVKNLGSTRLEWSVSGNVVENVSSSTRSFVEVNPMFFEVGSGFSGIPLENHSVSILLLRGLPDRPEFGRSRMTPFSPEAWRIRRSLSAKDWA
jgi:hypothetical protein